MAGITASNAWNRPGVVANEARMVSIISRSSMDPSHIPSCRVERPEYYLCHLALAIELPSVHVLHACACIGGQQQNIKNKIRGLTALTLGANKTVVVSLQQKTCRNDPENWQTLFPASLEVSLPI